MKIDISTIIGIAFFVNMIGLDPVDSGVANCSHDMRFEVVEVVKVEVGAKVAKLIPVLLLIFWIGDV